MVTPWRHQILSVSGLALLLRCKIDLPLPQPILDPCPIARALSRRPQTYTNPQLTSSLIQVGPSSRGVTHYKNKSHSQSSSLSQRARMYTSGRAVSRRSTSPSLRTHKSKRPMRLCSKLMGLVTFWLGWSSIVVLIDGDGCRCENGFFMIVEFKGLLWSMEEKTRSQQRGQSPSL